MRMCWTTMGVTVVIVSNIFQPKCGGRQVFNVFPPILFFYEACDNAITFPNVSCSGQQQNTDAIRGCD